MQSGKKTRTLTKKTIPALHPQCSLLQ